MTGAEESALACAEFHDALLKQGFESNAAVTIVAAWMSRSVTDMAAYNAVFENFAEKLTEEKL